VRAFLIALAACSLLAAPASAQASKKHPPKRRGGEVRRIHNLPKGPLARFLARQVGPVKTVPKARHRSLLAYTSAVSPSFTADASGNHKLYLVRSYDIPADDPSATRLANLSWTYDSAVAAIAFDSYGATYAAQELLDQLKALQRTDGSLDFAYDVSNGDSVQQFRTGTIAWAGYAALLHELKTQNGKYNSLISGVADWLLQRQNATTGLLTGGPDVNWVSTQNNMVAYLFFATLAGHPIGDLKASDMSAVANKIAGGIDSRLTITPAAGQLGFVQGINDPVRPLDAQTLGVMYLVTRNRAADAAKVRAYIDAAFKVTNRTIVKSSATSTYNMTYAANGPFTGYRPYATGGPDVLWEEGTAQALVATDMLGQDDTAQNAALVAWGSVGPLQADRTVTNSSINEYHVWPASAAASWMMLGAFGLPR
jgi:hypothetical protein